MKLKTILLLATWVCGVASLQAQEVRKYGNEFLSIGVGARAHGMGASQSAHAFGGNAGYWNPAGIVNMRSNFEVNFMHAEWFGGISQYDYFSLATSLGEEKKSALALSVIRMAVDDIPNTFNLIQPDGTINTDLIQSFSAADYAGLISYSRRMKAEGLRLGVNAKIIYRTLGQFSNAWGFGLDAGLQYDSGHWRLGLMARDLTSTFTAWTFSFSEEEMTVLQQENNEIPENSVEVVPPRFILGMAYSTRKKNDQDSKLGLLASVDFDFTTDGQRNVLVSSPSFNMAPRMGVELDFKQMVFLRAGLNNFQQIPQGDGSERWDVQPNFGLGLLIGDVVSIDYAFNDVGSAGSQSGSLYSHIISASLHLQPKNRTSKKRMDPVFPTEKKPAKKEGFPDYIEQID